MQQMNNQNSEMTINKAKNLADYRITQDYRHRMSQLNKVNISGESEDQKGSSDENEEGLEARQRFAEEIRNDIAKLNKKQQDKHAGSSKTDLEERIFKTMFKV